MSNHWPLCATRMSSPTNSRNSGPDLLEGRLVAEIVVAVAVHLGGRRMDGAAGTHQPLELLHHHPAPDPHRGDLDDPAVRDLLVGGLQVEGDVVLERVLGRRGSSGAGAP